MRAPQSHFSHSQAPAKTVTTIHHSMENPNRSHLLKNRRQKKSPAEESSQTSITDLHEAILLHILSFLTTPAAIKTSAVAPPWRNLWCSLPKLEFDMHYFQKRIPGNSDNEGRLQFAEFVSQALLRRPSHFPVQKFKLLFFYRNYDLVRAHVNLWVLMLAALTVVELDLNFVDYGMGNDDDEEDDDEIFALYDFDFSNIVSSSIEVLKLSGCYLSFPCEEELCIKLPSIKEIHLGDFHGDADEIEQLMASCVNLETFVLVYSGSSPNLNIVSESLRHLTFVGVSDLDSDKTSVEICTPRLESIEFDRYCCGMYTLKDVSSLVEATIGFFNQSWWDFACWTNVVSSLTCVERLDFHNFFVQDESAPKTYEDVRALVEEEGAEHPLHLPKSVEKLKFGEKVFSEAFEFRNLKYLTVKTGYMEDDILSLEVLLKKCPRLESLVLVCFGYSHEDEQLEEGEIADSLIAFQIPRLKEVKMEGYLGTKNELYVVDLFKKHGVVLENIMAFPAKVGQISPPPFVL